MSSNPSSLEDHVGYWLRMVSNHTSARFAAMLAGQGVTTAEWVLLRVLWEEGAVAPSALATRAGLTRGAVTKLVDRLRAKRLVVRAAGAAADKRFQTIALTGEGAKLLPRLALLADENDRAMFGGLSERERGTLLHALRAVARGAGLSAPPLIDQETSMTPEQMAVIRECTDGSDAGTKPFPMVVAALGAGGIERYHADLVRAEKTYYLPDGSSASLQCRPVCVAAAGRLDTDGVAGAVRAAQAGAVDYRTFCERITAAGCVGYHVSLPGRRAVYYGRDAAQHVEHFPD